MFCIVSPFLLSLCSTGRRLAVPSSIEVHGERYCIDTLRARWLRIGDAPECTYLYFRNMRDSIVDTRKAYYVIGPEKKLTGLLKRDIVDGRVEEYYEDMEWWYYRGDAALFFPPDIGQRLHFLWEGNYSGTPALTLNRGWREVFATRLKLFSKFIIMPQGMFSSY